MSEKKDNPPAAVKPRKVSVSRAASILHSGDESQVWADIAGGILKATVLVEVADGREFTESLCEEWARRFLAGDGKCREKRNLAIKPIVGGGTTFLTKGQRNVECVGRRATVIVEIRTDQLLVKPTTVRSDTTHLNIIGGLLELILGETPAGKKQSVFTNQTAVIDALKAHYNPKLGISKRTLEEKFAAAKRSIKG